jgi:hypothetical protein
MEWKSPGKGQTGRPRIRWLKGIQAAMAQEVVGEGQWMNKEEW